MVTREWSERHIIELIKKNSGGAGDPIVSVAAPTMNLQSSLSPSVPRDVLIVINSQEATYQVDPVGTYYTVDNRGSVDTSRMAPSNFVTGQPFAGFMWPREIQNKYPNFPFRLSSSHTLDMMAAGGTGNQDYLIGSASFRIRMTSNWSSNLTISSRPSLSGVWGGVNDDRQRFYVLEIMNSGVQDLAQNYVDTYGRNPTYITAWHTNSPVPYP